MSSVALMGVLRADAPIYTLHTDTTQLTLAQFISKTLHSRHFSITGTGPTTMAAIAPHQLTTLSHNIDIHDSPLYNVNRRYYLLFDAGGEIQ